MARIILYVDLATQQQLRDADANLKMSQSQFVGELIRRSTPAEWPDDVLRLAGSVPDFPAAETLRTGVRDDAPRTPW